MNIYIIIKKGRVLLYFRLSGGGGVAVTFFEAAKGGMVRPRGEWGWGGEILGRDAGCEKRRMGSGRYAVWMWILSWGVLPTPSSQKIDGGDG